MTSVFAAEKRRTGPTPGLGRATRDDSADVTPAAMVEIVIPVYNEQAVLEANVRRLRSYLDEQFPFSAMVTIADNASTDDTWIIAKALGQELGGVRAVHLDQKGRGRALRAVWSSSPSAVVAYMDVDLATDLDGLLPLVAPLLSGHSDLAIGTRLAHGSQVRRGTKREVISRSYNLIVRAAMRTGVSDVQCGFKAMSSAAAAELLPLVVDEGWFFDTEVLILAEANGMRIHEVPVDWDDDHDSRVKVVSTALDDLKGLVRVSRSLAAGQCRSGTDAARSLSCRMRFGGIGGISTFVYLALFLAFLRPAGALSANAVSLTIAATLNAAAHSRLTQPTSATDGYRAGRLHRGFLREAFFALVAGLMMSSAALGAVMVATTSVSALLASVLAANAIVSGFRFVSFRARMFRASGGSGDGR